MNLPDRIRRAVTRHRQTHHFTAEERYALDVEGATALDGMPADWPLWTLDMFEQARLTADVPEATPDAWANVDHVLATPPAHRVVMDLDAALAAATDHDDQLAYEAGAQVGEMHDLDVVDEEDALILARRYLARDPQHGARRAALVLAGYTHTPMGMFQ